MPTTSDYITAADTSTGVSSYPDSSSDDPRPVREELERQINEACDWSRLGEGMDQLQPFLELRVTRVEKGSPALEEKHKRFCRALSERNPCLAYHGTSPENSRHIRERGLDPKCSKEGRRMFGRAVYLSPSPEKALDYVDPKNPCLVVAEVAQGRVCKLKKSDSSLTKPPKGYDSVRRVVEKGSGLRGFEEIVLYEEYQALPRYVVWVYLRVKAGTPAESLNPDGGGKALDIALGIARLPVVKKLVVKAVISAGGKSSSPKIMQKLLMEAIEAKDVSAVSKLVEGGASVNPISIEGPNPLHAAVKSGSLELVSLVLSNGARSNVEKEYKKTALFFAAEQKRLDILKCLLVAGWEVDRFYHCDSKRGFGVDVRSFIDFCVEVGDFDLLSLVLSYADGINTVDYYGNNALMYAAFAGNLSLVTKLLEAGSNPNQQGNCKRTYLVEIGSRCARKHGELKGAEADLHGVIVEKFLGFGANPDITDVIGNTALTNAAFFGAKGIVQALINGSANLNTRGKDGDTALMIAIMQGETEVALMLIGAGADLRVVNKGSSAISIARNTRNVEVVQAIHGTSFFGCLAFCC